MTSPAGCSAMPRHRTLRAHRQRRTRDCRCSGASSRAATTSSAIVSRARGEVRIVADAGPLGYLSIAAHGHADALSFTLSAGGCELLIDPGTYAYHTHKRWRDYFRGTTAHNTVRVDLQDQSLNAGNFLWLRHARRAAHQLRDARREEERLIAEHDGYARLQDPVLHRRELCFAPASATLTVRDELPCRGEHQLELFWHFAEDCEVGSTAGLIARNGPAVLSMTLPARLRWELGAARRLRRSAGSPALSTRSVPTDDALGFLADSRHDHARHRAPGRLGNSRAKTLSARPRASARSAAPGLRAQQDDAVAIVELDLARQLAVVHAPAPACRRCA